jgi:hypothetical protein
VGVAGRSERRVLGRGAHGELVEVGLADADGTGRAEALDDRGVIGRHPAGQDPAGAAGGHAAGDQVVLQRDGHAGKGAGVIAGRHLGIDCVGGGPRFVGGDAQEGVEVGVGLVDGGERLVDHLASGAFAGPDGRSGLEC